MYFRSNSNFIKKPSVQLKVKSRRTGYSSCRHGGCVRRLLWPPPYPSRSAAMPRFIVPITLRRDAPGHSATLPAMNRSNSQALETWQAMGHRGRCRIVASARHPLAAACDELVSLCRSPTRSDPIETIASELIPLCAALKFIGRRGPSVLRSERVGAIGRPIWLWGVRSEIQRVARGDVLVLAAWNYPLLLAGVQIAQALAAGNRVYFKPAPGCESVGQRLVEMFWQAGVPPAILQPIPSAAQSAIDLIDRGVDLVVLTGSSVTGRAVLRQCSETLTPTILELSGCDAVIIGADADLQLAAKAIRFGLMFNGGATCIGPRRILVAKDVKSRLVDLLRSAFENVPPVSIHDSAIDSVRETLEEMQRCGATDLLSPSSSVGPFDASSFYPILFDQVSADSPIAHRDLFAPIASLIDYDTDSEAIAIVNRCRYRLAASVFGSPGWAGSIANRLQVGTVVINDIVFPTADPRLPFGGRGESGFGVTRGAQGLLEMTLPRVIASHRGKVHVHLAARTENDFLALASSLTLIHGRFGQKWAALRRLCSGVKWPSADSCPADRSQRNEVEK